MAAPASMNVVIHDAIRRDLDRFATALADFSDGDRQRAARLGRAWDFFHQMLTSHHDGEEEHFFPAFRYLGVDGDLLDSMQTEHQAMHDALELTAAAMSALTDSASVSDAREASVLMAQLTDVVHRHLAHEEGELGPVVAPMAKETAFVEAEKRVRGELSPIQAARFMAWVQNGAPEENRAFLRNMIPSPVLFVLTSVLGRGYTSMAKAAWG